jgi:GTP-binding protein EngB required for normal cell division
MTSGAPPWPGLPAAVRPRRGVAGFGPVPNVTTGLAGSEFADPDLTGGGPGLPSRLTALARLIQIGAARGGDSGFPADLLAEAEELLARSGERLRLSASHTVVSLAGGTGSGKSSLFNRLAGAEFSTAGVTRPVTRDAHACVWGVAGSAPLLEWLGIPRRNRYARSSALDRGEEALAGLVLLDLPDHDSVISGASDQVDRLIGLADLMVWVLDPQKYADAAVHRRFLVPLAGHSEVVAVVLNQADLLTEQQTEDCVGDLRRLLESEGLHDVTILATSAKTGAGLEELRKLLTDAVSQRRAASARISADLDAMLGRFVPYVSAEVAQATGASRQPAEPDDLNGSLDGAAELNDAAALNGPAGLNGAGEAASPGESGTPGMPGTPAGAGPVASGLAGPEVVVAPAVVPGQSTTRLVEAFAGAAGVTAVSDALRSARELRAVDYIGWPVAWLADRFTGRGPIRKLQLGKLWDEVAAVSAGPSGAQQAEIDQALTGLADEIGPTLPKPWSGTVRTAIRSRAEDVPPALGTAMAQTLPTEDKIVPWWRFIGALQGLLLGAVIVGLAWIGAILAFGVFHAARHVPRLFDDLALIPWVCVIIAAFLFLGWLIASGCMNLVQSAALREHERIDSEMRSRITVVARELVVVPAEQELSEYQRFQEELLAAAGRA